MTMALSPEEEEAIKLIESEKHPHFKVQLLEI